MKEQTNAVHEPTKENRHSTQRSAVTSDTKPLSTHAGSMELPPTRKASSALSAKTSLAFTSDTKLLYTLARSTNQQISSDITRTDTKLGGPYLLDDIHLACASPSDSLRLQAFEDEIQAPTYSQDGEEVDFASRAPSCYPKQGSAGNPINIEDCSAHDIKISQGITVRRIMPALFDQPLRKALSTIQALLR